MLNRRTFVGTTLGAAGASLLTGRMLAQLAAAPASLPPRSLYDANEDTYWAELRKQFLIPSDMIYLNNGTIGSSPAPVLRAVFDSYAECEKLTDEDPEQYPIWGYGPWNQFRDPLAAFVGCTRDEIALVRNATEGNSFMANGIDMKAGDEVVMTDQEHPGGEQPWQVRAKRYGIVLKKVVLPRPAQNASQILNLFNDAISPRTRVLFFSHITTTTGVVLPAKELCALARTKGLISAVDGAHVCGMMHLNLRDLGCDLYSSSPHKWLQAPKGTGFLFVRDEMIDQLWSTTLTEGWDQKNIRAQRFQQLGTCNVPVLAGMRAAIQLATEIGMDRIERRHRQLADGLLSEMTKRGAESWTSPDPALRCALVTVNVPPVPRMDLEKWLWATHKIRIRGGDPHKLRLSTPYYVLKTDLTRFLEKFDEYRKMKATA